jgi:hypothetical protein
MRAFPSFSVEYRASRMGETNGGESAEVLRQVPLKRSFEFFDQTDLTTGSRWAKTVLEKEQR